MLGGGDSHSTGPCQGSRCWGVEADNLHVNIYAGEDNKPLINPFPSDRREDDPGGNLNLHHYAFNKSHEAHPDGSVADPYADVNVTTGGSCLSPLITLLIIIIAKLLIVKSLLLSQQTHLIPMLAPIPVTSHVYQTKFGRGVQILWLNGPNNRTVNYSDLTRE